MPTVLNPEQPDAALEYAYARGRHAERKRTARLMRDVRNTCGEDGNAALDRLVIAISSEGITSDTRDIEAFDQSNRRAIQNLMLLLNDLTDFTRCRLDHHGFCQEHGWMEKSECPHARAQKLIPQCYHLRRMF